MFTMLFNDDQKKEFIKLVHHLANCDNHIHQKEKELIEHYLYETRLSEDDIMYYEENIDFQKINKIFNEIRLKKIALFELVALSYSDSNFSPEEYNFIIKLSEIFEIDKEDLDKLMESGKKLIEVINEVNSLIYST